MSQNYDILFRERFVMNLRLYPAKINFEVT